MTPPPTPQPGEAVRLRFAPEGRAARLRFALQGRPLVWSALRRAERVSADLNVQERFHLQQEISRQVLGHLGVQLDVRGLENIGPGPYLIAPLHEGIADVLCLLQLPLPMRFVARREIFGWPSVGAAITRLGHLPIDPEHLLGGFRDLWRGTSAILGGGESVVVFPQGTVVGIQADFQRGVFEVARRVGAAILPVALSGTHRIWEHPFAPTLRYGQPVALTVLPPISARTLQTAHLDTLRVQTRQAVKAAALAPGLPPPRFFDPDRDGYWDGFRLVIDPDFSTLAARMERHRAALLTGTA
ncbi:1-acyl-sn-glycerol-3-phosphate acyltransferase [Deinococcus radiopugnans ATCC 19172]|uniref:1-acyl-sn-glycerol-3-phosphate acyltransferase n=1 Tax=Deinococcus radiopugnans ATCC 19172 TaxID=585398 RepID=A0ABR6NP00_9DEIO|nr:lysophospholipid acyltransferase family protein [Deinococcus radiopugnans]MBB6015174.1 1-acyl-sn-glycerol-3-phosphate acyltransferase [Deinococcus radiopugnans ATCC 19172]